MTGLEILVCQNNNAGIKPQPYDKYVRVIALSRTTPHLTLKKLAAVLIKSWFKVCLSFKKPSWLLRCELQKRNYHKDWSYNTVM